MALFKVRRTSTPGLIPQGLTYGEMAVNIPNRRLYIGDVQGATIEILGGSGGDGTGATWASTVPTTATDINGIPAGTVIDQGLNSIQILEKILYPYQSVSFSGFTLGLASFVFDLGQTSASGSYNSSWSANGPTGNWIAGSVGISREGTTLVSGLNYNSDDPSGYPISHPSYRYTSPYRLTFSLTGAQAQGTNPVPTSRSYDWLHRIYYGKSAADPTSISNLSSGGYVYASSTTSLGTRTYIIGSSATPLYAYLVVPTAPGSPGSYTSIKDINGFTLNPVEGTFTETNSHGVSITWKWYRVSNPTTAEYRVTAS